jgi:hypothetical protein
MSKLLIAKEPAQAALDFLANKRFLDVYQHVPLLLNLPVDEASGKLVIEAESVKAILELLSKVAYAEIATVANGLQNLEALPEQEAKPVEAEVVNPPAEQTPQ